MLTITETASEQLNQLLQQAPDEAVIRLVSAQDGLAIQLSEKQPGDTTYEVGDRTVLALDATVNETLAEKTLDIQPTDKGPQLVLRQAEA